MKITETALCQAQNTKKTGEINYSFMAQPVFEQEMFSLNVDINFYKKNQKEFEKDVLNFIRYTILGYTQDDVEVVEEEQKITEKPEYILEEPEETPEAPAPEPEESIADIPEGAGE